MVTSKKTSWVPGPATELRKLPHDTWERFAAAVVKRPGFVGALFAQYLDHAQYIIRQDSIRTDLLAALSLIGVPFDPSLLDIQHINVTRREVKITPSPEWVAEVRRTEAEYIERVWSEA
jgi:hypothetical protein